MSPKDLRVTLLEDTVYAAAGPRQVGLDPIPETQAFVIIWFTSPFSPKALSSVRAGAMPVFRTVMSLVPGT